MNRKDEDGYIILTKTQKQLITQVTKADFEPDLFGTLTFSADPFNGKVNTFNKGLIEKQYNEIDSYISQLLCRLNRRYVSNRWYKKDKKSLIQSIFSIEIHNLLFHCHFVAQTPTGHNQHDFRCDIQNYWQSLKHCFRAQIKIDRIPPEDIVASVAYISKDFEKDNSLGYSKHTNFS